MSKSEPLSYIANGMTMVGELAIPEGAGPFPAVLIAHGAPGLDSFIRSRPRALADLGFVALAIDYHGNGEVFTDPVAQHGRLQVFGNDVDLIRSVVTAGFATLCANDNVDQNRLFALGYCFGAVVVMELARTGVDIKATVGFHPGLTSLRPEDSAQIRGSVLMCIGADDPIVGPPARLAFEDEMRAADVDYEIVIYGGAKHRFTDPDASRANNPALEFHPKAAERSWQAMLDLFAEISAPNNS